jgi:sec-independent protein translocase protein TatB
MFDFDLGKLLLIGVVALIFIPPKDLPQVLRQLGRMIGKARRIAADFQSQFNEAIRDTELEDLRDEFRSLKEQASVKGAVGQIADIIEESAKIPPISENAPAAEKAVAADPPAPAVGPPAPAAAAPTPAPDPAADPLKAAPEAAEAQKPAAGTGS